MKNLILNYYSQSVLAKNTIEAVNFINSLNGITANQYIINILEDYFSLGGSQIQNIWKTGRAFEIATTGCGKTRIYAYKPLANTLEVHNILVAKKKEEQAQEAEKRKREQEQAYLSEMYEQNKGWYIVTVSGNAFKIRGNDGKITKSVKVLADNKMDAFNKAVQNLEENPPKNVMMWGGFESSRTALIEYIGVWTDEAEFEYGS